MADKKDYILVAEEEAKERIIQIQAEKESIIKQAKDKARKDLKSHEIDLQQRNQMRITELYSNNILLDEIDKKNLVEIKEIEEKNKINADKAVRLLFETVTKVSIVIPDVVKAEFEKENK